MDGKSKGGEQQMTPEEANATVEAAIAKGTARYKAPDYAELQTLLKIYMSELSDWHLQLAFLISDGRYEKAANILAPYNITVQKIAGVVNKLLPDGPAKKDAD
jgi:hypothetical protein